MLHIFLDLMLLPHCATCSLINQLTWRIPSECAHKQKPFDVQGDLGKYLGEKTDGALKLEMEMEAIPAPGLRFYLVWNHSVDGRSECFARGGHVTW
jgi:hypothetical protein